VSQPNPLRFHHVVVKVYCPSSNTLGAGTLMSPHLGGVKRQ
jgi:hypothetical protein